MSTRSRMSFNIRHNTLAGKKNDYFQNIASGQITSRENWGGSVDEVYTISPTSILNLRLNYTYMYESATDSSEGFNPTSLGFPSYIGANTVRPSLPYVYFDTSTAFQSLGYNQAASAPVAIGSALRKLDQAQGQSQLQGGHRPSSEPPEHHHLRIRVRRIQFRRQPVGQPECQRVANRSHGTGHGAVSLRAAHAGLLRHQHVRLLVFLLRLRVRAGRLAREAQPHAQPGPALRLRWSRQREVRAHGERLGLRYAEPDRGGRHRGLQPEADRTASGRQFQRAGRVDLPEREGRRLREHVAPDEPAHRHRLVAGEAARQDRDPHAASACSSRRS